MGKLYLPLKLEELPVRSQEVFFAQAIGRELIKFIPGFGSVIAASWAAAYTWSLGEGACVLFWRFNGG